MVANINLNMDLLNARSRTYSAAICAQMRGDSAYTSISTRSIGIPVQQKSRITTFTHNNTWTSHRSRLLLRAEILNMAFLS
jgi:hypothetical protein